VQVGFQVYGGAPGAYLPVIHGVRDKLTFIQVQLYNTGSVLGLTESPILRRPRTSRWPCRRCCWRVSPVGGNPDRFFPGLA